MTPATKSIGVRRAYGSLCCPEAPGRQWFYMIKRQEAAACLNDPQPDSQNYVYLSAEIGRMGQNLLEVANAVIIAARRADQYFAQIERTRMDAADLIEAAQNHDAVEAAATSVVWPMLKAERSPG